MNKSDKYRRASEVIFTPKELAQANANFAYGAQRFPAEHRAAAAKIAALGLTNHRAVLDYYLHNKFPMDPSTVGHVGMYADSTYEAGFNVGRQTVPGSPMKPIPPDGA